MAPILWASIQAPISNARNPKKNVQSLEYSKCAEAELCTEYREKVVEKGHWPRDLGQEEEEELQGDKKTVYDGPKDTCRLIGDGATSEVRHVRVKMTAYQIPEEDAHPM